MRPLSVRVKFYPDVSRPLATEQDKESRWGYLYDHFQKSSHLWEYKTALFQQQVSDELTRCIMQGKSENRDTN